MRRAISNSFHAHEDDYKWRDSSGNKNELQKEENALKLNQHNTAQRSIFTTFAIVNF